MANKMLQVPCTLFWLFHNKPDKFGNYSGTFGLLSPETKKELQDAGLKVKYDADREEGDENHQGFFLKARSNEQPRVVDTQKNVIPSSLLVGNGSKAVAIIEAKDWLVPDTGASGTKAILRGIMVTELVKYDPDATSKAKADALLDDIPGEGFVFGESNTSSSDPESEDSTTKASFEEMFGDDG